MPLSTMNDLFKETVQDQYNAEQQLMNILPKMAKKADTPELKSAIEYHQRETEEHVRRIEKFTQELGFKPTGRISKGMQGLIEETEQFMKEGTPSPVLDAGLIGCLQKAKHYEIAGYGTLAAQAQTLGFSSAVNLLRTTLTEEHKSDEKFNNIALKEVNKKAVEAGAYAKTGKAEMI